MMAHFSFVRVKNEFVVHADDCGLLRLRSERQATKLVSDLMQAEAKVRETSGAEGTRTNMTGRDRAVTVTPSVPSSCDAQFDSDVPNAVERTHAEHLRGTES